MKIHQTILPVLALGAAAALSIPMEEAEGFSKLGPFLDVEDKRDFRVFNNFADAEANDNQTPHAQFPGWLGAEMALWKAASEWASGTHGDGSGDPTQVKIGDGLANFDFSWQGNAAAAGGGAAKVISTIPNCGGSTLAFVQLRPTGAWTMKFCDNWVWDDGPDMPALGDIDLQGVATHELGHALGLGHSVPGTVMAPSTVNGLELRNLSADDIAGLQCIYNPINPLSKPSITAVSVNATTHEITITGSNFTDTDNEVWFTNRTVTQPTGDPRSRLTGVPSINGGTEITVCIPGDAGSGDVLVRKDAPQGVSLSNAFPVEIPDPPLALSLPFNGSNTNLFNFSEVTPPLIGTNWETFVALTGGETQSRVVVSLNGGNCHMGGLTPMKLGGTELLALPPYLKPHDASPDGNHSLPISLDCELYGQTFCIQGFGVEFGPLQFTGYNALIVTVGAGQ